MEMEVCEFSLEVSVWRKKRENGKGEDEDEVESEGMRCKHVVRVYIGGLSLGLTTNEM